MSSLLPEVEGWVKVAGAATAVLMAALVPIRSWIVEDRRYRAQTLEALAAAPKAIASGAAGTSNALADSLALEAVADGLRDVASAIRRLADSDETRGGDRLAKALSALLRRHDGDLA